MTPPTPKPLILLIPLTLPSKWRQCRLKSKNCASIARRFWLKKKAETEKRRAEQAEKDKQAEEIARKKGDFDALEKQYQDKIKALEQQLQDNIAERNHDLIASQALKIASQLSTNANNQELLQVTHQMQALQKANRRAATEQTVGV